MAGVFYILAAGAFVSLVTCVVEYIWFKYLGDNSPRELDRSHSVSNDLMTPARDTSKDIPLYERHLDGEVIRNHSVASLHSPTIGVRRASKPDHKGSSSREVNLSTTAIDRRESSIANSITPDNSPPYLDYLPLKTVSKSNQRQHQSSLLI